MGAEKQKPSMDMVNGSLWNKILWFALPVAATGILGQLFNAADIAVVGNFTGDMSTAAVAAVGANSSLINLLVNLVMGLALGANVTIAHAVGEGEHTAVEKAVHTAMVISVLGGVCLTVIGEILAEPVLGLMQVPDEVLPLALLYLRIYLAGLSVILLYNFEAAIFRSVGETRMPLMALAASGVLNVILNLFFVAVLHMTVNGVALATVISNAVSAAILYWRLRVTTQPIRVDPRKLKIDAKSFKRIVQIGMPAGIQSAVFSVANILVQSSVNSLGLVAMAASSASSNIESFAYLLLNSFSQTCTTFVGQNYGAGKLNRCKKSMVLCLVEGFIALGSAILLILTFGRSLLGIFDSSPDVIELGYDRLVLILSAYSFSLLYETMAGYMRGFGLSLPPAVLTIVGVCGIRLTWIYAVFPKNRTLANLMTVYPVSLSATALLMVVAVLIFHPSRRFRGKAKPVGEPAK